MHIIQIQRPKSKFSKIFFLSTFLHFTNFDFWWVKIYIAYLVNPKTRLFRFTTPEAEPLQALPCLRWAVTLKILPWPLEVKLWPWSKINWRTFLINFDELSNAIFSSSLALLGTKIAIGSVTFCLGGGGNFENELATPRHFWISKMLAPLNSAWPEAWE